MPTGDEQIQALRDALALSPENIPLRQHLAATLMGLGRNDEAIAEYRAVLSQSPDNLSLKQQLAEAYYQAGKKSEALVIVEDLVAGTDPPAEALVLHTRLLLAAGDVRGAVAQYKLALDADPDVRDPLLSEELGVGLDEDDLGDVFEGRVRQAAEPDESAPVDLERPTIAFRNVGGMADLKEEIGMKIIYPLQHPEIYEQFGKSIGGGILMYGPPGCGKTHLARATAGEIDAGFISIGISDVLDMWIGTSERNLHELFQQARQNKPCVLFFDEVDALGARRSDMRTSGGRQLINQFLSEMDGLDASNDGVLILAATNAPWSVDPAFRRPGRFDRVLFVPPPDRPARAEILRILCEGKPTEKLDYENLAKKSDNFSGADLKAVVDVAIEQKLREAMKQGGIQPLTNKDLLGAIKKLKPTTREWFSTARNYALYSNQGGAYDDVLKYMDQR